MSYVDVSAAPVPAGEPEKFLDQDKKIVRDNLLEAIIQAPHIIRYAEEKKLCVILICLSRRVRST
jgi:hypothetical protein